MIFVWVFAILIGVIIVLPILGAMAMGLFVIVGVALAPVFYAYNKSQNN